MKKLLFWSFRSLFISFVLIALVYSLLTILVINCLLTPRLRVGNKTFSFLRYSQADEEVKKITPFQTYLVFKKKTTTKKLNFKELGITVSYSQGWQAFKNNYRRKNLYQRWRFYQRSLITPTPINPKITYNIPNLSKYLNNQFKGEWPSSEEAKLTYLNHRLVLLPAKAGYTIDEQRLEKQLLLALKLIIQKKSPPVIIIPLKKIIPQPNQRRINQLYQQANCLLKKKIILYRDKTKVYLSPQEKISLLSFDSTIDEDSLENIIASKADTFNHLPQNALFEFKNGRVHNFKPSHEGFKLDKDQLKEKFITVWPNICREDKTEIKIKVPGSLLQPLITTKSTNSFGIKELLAKGESWFYHSSAGRVHNIKLAASKLNGILVPPGQIFSFNQSLGQVSAASGYQQSYVIKDGKTILDDGGGVCQVSTTLFRAVLRAGLPILERHAHSYRVGYYEQHSPPGFDATVFGPYVDFKFKNDLKSYLLIQSTTDLTKHHLVFSLYGSSDGRKVVISPVRIWDQIPPPPPLYQDDPNIPPGQVKQVEWPAWGAKVAFDWQVIKDKKIICQKTFYSFYKPWRAVYLN